MMRSRVRITLGAGVKARGSSGIGAGASAAISVLRDGTGAMATVFKARQLSLDRMVAIKVLPKRLSENAEYVERFYKEGKAAAKKVDGKAFE